MPQIKPQEHLCGTVYECDIQKDQFERLVEDVFGYSSQNTEFRKKMDDLYSGNTVRIPVEWAKAVPSVRVGLGDCFSVSSHFGSEELVFMEALHPVIRGFLERENLHYSIRCRPCLANLLGSLEQGGHNK